MLMGRNYFDYDFRWAWKDCVNGYTPDGKRESYKCRGKACQWYRMCDYEWKDPPEPPILPKEGRLLF